MKILNPETMVSMPLSGLKLIEASAGTGKTYAIANLYLRYVHEGWSVRQLLVVTFTNAATEELRGRLRERLYSAMQYLEIVERDPERDKRDAFLDLLFDECTTNASERAAALLRLKLAVRSMDEAAIYTIHGFCQRALTDHAFNSNQSFDISLLSDDDELWTQALKDWWRRQLYDASIVEGRLFLRANDSLKRFMARQRPLRDTRHCRIIPDPGKLPSMRDLHVRWSAVMAEVADLAEAWAQRHDQLREVLERSKSLKRNEKNGYRLQELSPELDCLHDWFSRGDFDHLPPVFDRLTESRLQAECKKPVSDKGGDPALSDPFFVGCQRIMEKATAIVDGFSLASLHDATREGKREVEVQKQGQRVMAFSDQLNRLLAAVNGTQGEALTRNLRQSFPVAMIDEFQDTDEVQYRIFRELYPCEPESENALIMIGDPKQAIYSFRGGDIFTYMAARRDAGELLYTLNTNWRSVPRLIQAVNTLFDNRENAFIYSDAIEFNRVSAAEKEHAPLMEAGAESVPVTFWKLPESENKAWSNDMGDQLLHQAVTTEIRRLLLGAGRGQVTLGDRAVVAGDIAVLVREKRQGTALRKVLGEAGITAVTVSTDKVFQSDEATGLLRLLQGVVHCQSRASLRVALGSSLLAHDYMGIAAVVDDEARWMAWADELRDLHGIWARKGFMVMFQKMMQSLEVALCLAGHQSGTDDAERRLTNVLHLAELLQQNAAVHPGMDALLMWFSQQIQDASEEEAELRLESDENLVRIVTIHASKGLQYPIVFVPYLSRCRPVKMTDGVLSFHDENHQACIDISERPASGHLVLAEKERLAEDVRLLYVALTRAEAKLYIGWGKIGASPPTTPLTALAYLLYPDPSGVADLAGDDFYRPLQSLADASAGSIEVQPLPDSDCDAYASRHVSEAPTPIQASTLHAARFTGTIALDWRISSFSALTRDVHQAPHGGSVRGSDEIINFPAGSRVGLFLHAMLEEVDFTELTDEALSTLHRKHAARYGLDPALHQAVVIRWMRSIVNTPLSDDVPPLSGIQRRQRLDELPFDFSVTRVTAEALNSRLSRLAAAGKPGAEVPPLSVESFRGLVTGIIDLVFEHQGRYFIADYKSNFLGGQLSDYTPDQLDDAVLDRRYDLQYLLYTLALHRYLKQRVPDYDYARHFGGVFYLFLRGMRPEHGHHFGVWYRQPDAALIHEIDEWIHNGDD